MDISNRTPVVRDAILKVIRDEAADDACDVTLEQLAGIKKLDLINKGIENLKIGDFDGLWNLEVLDLSLNKLIELPERIFNGLENLELLDLSWNKLRDLSAGVFDGLDNLESLYLRRNNLERLPNGIFDGLKKLNWLDLGHNDLGKISVELLKDLFYDRKINIQGNEKAAIIESDGKGIGIGD